MTMKYLPQRRRNILSRLINYADLRFCGKSLNARNHHYVHGYAPGNICSLKDEQ